MKYLLAAITLLALGFTVADTSRAFALSGSEFQSGRIIDDGVFYNGSGLNWSDTQAFLNAKVPVCDTWGSQPYGGTTAAEYGTSRGYPPPYTCLKDYRQDTFTIPADSYCNGFTGGNKSAAQIIYEVGVSCGISQKVILITLQKEQSLITDDWPLGNQFQKATGYGCPDTALPASVDANQNGCYDEFEGYFKQVYYGARQFKRYAMDANTFTSYRPYKVSSIGYHPNGACGSGNVYIQNQATSSLYIYTPYQPNAAALTDLYGNGDLANPAWPECSSFGNRNFWRLFNDWFGNPLSIPLYASYHSQSPWPTLDPGSQTSVYLMYQNRGIVQWFDDISMSRAPAGTRPVHLATSNPINRSSWFSSQWPTPTRPALNFSAVYEADGQTLTADQHVVYPGQIVKFIFPINVPSDAGAQAFPEYFQPVAEGISNGGFNDTYTFLNIIVNPKPAVSWHNQGVYPSIIPGSSTKSFISYKNTGNTWLYDSTGLNSAPSGTNPVHLATSNPLNRSSIFSSSWPTPTRPALNFSAVYEADGVTLTNNQHTAKPGQIIKFDINFTAQAGQAAGTTRENFRPILEGTSDGYFPDQGAFLDATILSTSSATYTTLPDSINLTANQSSSIQITVRNDGNQTMPASTQVYSSNGADFSTPVWVSTKAITTLGQDLAPLQSKTITIPLLAPSGPSANNSGLDIDLRDTEGTRISLSSIRIPATIQIPTYSVAYNTQSAYPDLVYNESKPLSLAYKNTGNQVWYDDMGINTATTRNPRLVHLATAGQLNRNSNFAKSWPSPNRPAVNFTAVYEANGTTLAANQHAVQPGQIAKFEFQVSPTYAAAPGVHREYFQPIIEGTADGVFNFAWTFQDITVKQPILSALYAGQSAYPTVPRGATSPIYFSYKNQGNVNWYDNTGLDQALPGTWPIHLSTSHPLNRVSSFRDSSWPSQSRPAINFTAVYEANGTTLAANQHVVQPGQIAKFEFAIKAPLNTAPGTYREYFQPIAEGSFNGVFSDPWTSMEITVN